MPRTLSKSKLLAYRQCPRRLWLEMHRPDLRADNDASQAAFSVGHQVGDLARRLYDPRGQGVLIDPQAEGFESALARTQALMSGNLPVFEAGFKASGALAFADIMLPELRSGQRHWRMVEVKSSTSVKDYHRDDAAIQAKVARDAGVALSGIALAHIDSDWVYPGAEDYQGLLVERDLSRDAFARAAEVETWIAGANTVAASPSEPAVAPGKQCSTPYECGFVAHCGSGQAPAEYPVSWLPQIRSKALKQCIEDGATDMREVPDALLNEVQLRVKRHSVSGRTYFDAQGAASDLAAHKLPAYFIDFETISFAVPVWRGTRPYQAIPFQFSVHHLERAGKLEHRAFLDLSGDDPSRAFAQALIAACGEQGPIFVYNAGFETARIAELAERFPAMRAALQGIAGRVVDLLPIARARFYHPGQQGSWSIKQVLPAIAPDLRYEQLDGVQHGGAAMHAYQEAISTTTTSTRKSELEAQLLAYCQLDTLAMVQLWRFFSGNN